MFRLFVAGICVFLSFLQGMSRRHISVGPVYSSYVLFQDDEDERGIWRAGGEVGVLNIIPHVGFKVRAAALEYAASPELGPYSYKYIPVSFCTSFDILPFMNLKQVSLSLETGIGLYLWKGLYDGTVIELPSGGLMDEKDVGFITGLTLQIRPVEFIGIEYGTRYHYIASANLVKYGYYDKDDKLWEHGISVKALLPW